MRKLPLALALWALCLINPAAAGAEIYRLETGDELRLAVADHPELSGAFTVSPEGTIGLPILDGLRIAGSTLGEAKAAIRARVGARVLDAAVSVEIARHRPFFILGDVQRPGPYPWTPGLTAEIAVALAGGYRATSEVFAAAVMGVRAAETHANATAELVNASVQRARLRLELAEAPAFTFSEKLPVAAGPEELREAVERQRELFEARKAGFAEHTELLRKELSIRADEIASLEARSAAQQKLAEQLKSELRDVQSYVSRGLSPTSRLNELTREENRLQSDVLQTAVMMNQARQGQNQADLQLATLTRNRRAQILSALEETIARIERLTRQLRADEAVMAEADSTWRLSEAPTTFRIRQKENGVVRSTTDEGTLVQPGDVVTVRSPSRGGGAASDRRMASRGAGE